MVRRLAQICILAAGLVALAGASSAQAARQPFTVQTLHFATHVGPSRSTTCDVVGDLYRPRSATRRHPEPAILTTNGFGGSKDDQKTEAETYARHGYVVLSYSGLGFGGSGCKIELDDPAWDGRAAAQLIRFLGGGGRSTDGTRVNYVIHDRRAVNGRHYKHDPRVGMIGGSYGGQIQFAAAQATPRLDTIIPIITWNDLAYSLVPNNSAFDNGVSSSVPGIAKFEWATLFFSEGALVDGITGLDNDPSRVTDCPNYDPGVCPAFVKNASFGYPDAQTVNLLRHASVSSYMNKIRIPTLLAQGENDTLFNLHEAAATYEALRHRHVPVSMIWQSWGHSSLGPAPGEINQAHPYRTYEGRRFARWFGYYLKHTGRKPPHDFCYFRDWVRYTGIATPAYSCANRYPLARTKRYWLSGADALVARRGSAKTGSASFATSPAGAATSYSETSGSGIVAGGDPAPPSDVPGAFASFSTPALKHDLKVVGVPTLRVRITDPVQAAGGGDPSTQATLFFKLYDIAPDGTITLPDRLVSPVRVPQVGRPISVSLPGIVHRFPKGDRLELVVAGGDQAYRGNTASSPVTVETNGEHPARLRLPLAGR
jgi:predicted acyl esterase